MTQLIEWRCVNDPDFPMPYKHRQHQRRMHVQKNAVEQRRKLHRARHFNPIHPYSGNLY